MKTAVTVALDPCFAAGPFVFHDLAQAVEHATRLGFDALELFPGDVSQLPPKSALGGLAVSAVGTGAGWVKHKLTLTSPDAEVRRAAGRFARELSVAAHMEYAAPVIVGSMQGRWGDGVSRDDALEWLAEGIAGVRGARPLLVEPLNRYESNLLNTLDDAATLFDASSGWPEEGGVLADLFHMNIEEANLPQAIRDAGGHIGHVHFADSNRRPAGMGHTDFAPVVAALRDIGYAGYLSAECFPYPDGVAAAEATMAAIRRLTAG